MPREPMTPAQWLAKPWEGRLPFDNGSPIPDAPAPTNLQVLACLAAKNGGSFRVNCWGIMDSGGPYGVQGLTQDEALQLLGTAAFYNGLLVGSGQDHDNAPFEAELNRVVQLRGLAPADG